MPAKSLLQTEVDQLLVNHGVDKTRREIVSRVLGLRLSRDPHGDEEADRINDEINERQAWATQKQEPTA